MRKYDLRVSGHRTAKTISMSANKIATSTTVRNDGNMMSGAMKKLMNKL